MRPVSPPLRLLVLAALCLAAACQLVVDLDGLEDQHCGIDEKVCGTTCVPNNDPATGCNDPGCAPCAPAHAIAICGPSNHCFFDTCLPGWDNCDGKAETGCETDLAHDRDNCGSCDRDPCPKPAHGIAGCSAGECGVGGCDPGWGDCNGKPFDGCETMIWTDQECLACGVPCPGGTTCEFGVCISGET